jgi:toxin ParE1/3/4
MLAEHPGAGPARDELMRGLRSFPVGNYLLLYRPAIDGIELVRVSHGARNLRRLFRGKP